MNPLIEKKSRWILQLEKKLSPSPAGSTHIRRLGNWIENAIQHLYELQKRLIFSHFSVHLTQWSQSDSLKYLQVIIYSICHGENTLMRSLVWWQHTQKDISCIVSVHKCVVNFISDTPKWDFTDYLISRYYSSHISLCL